MTTGLRLLLACALLPIPAMATEQPPYEIVGNLGEVEIRSYPAILWAETRVEGEFDRAGNTGFRRLASFIFGANRVPGGAEASEKIAMTAPVAMRPTDPGGGGAPAAWVIGFAMPGKWTLDTVPQPIDSAVTLRLAPGRTVAALRFSGTWSPERFAARERELLAALAASRWRAAGPVETARYDPPWTPWFMRRNEVLVEILPAE